MYLKKVKNNLIEYYKHNESNLCTKLGKFVKKGPPPLKYCKLGKANLLHRATKHNNLNVVKEILSTSYRNLDAKDENGMTAVHLAAINKVSAEIMKLLIENGSALASRDSVGNTPLHYACKFECKEMVELLIGASKPLIYARNTFTHEVPLHEAAKVGNLEIVKILLQNNAATNGLNTIPYFLFDNFVYKKEEKEIVEPKKSFYFYEPPSTISTPLSSYKSRETIPITEEIEEHRAYVPVYQSIEHKPKIKSLPLPTPTSYVEFNEHKYKTEHEHENKNYDFGYHVTDYKSGNNFGHTQSKKQNVINGQYSILMPDGRIQVTKYIADDSGFHADISYKTIL
ncbi:hypothetical protein PVAND_003736 [Polypedilum vanderplanki]|uniref:Ankyrin repeat protein n=1 Tax=Polypedilum vanderplanki TaxID=319348 RepID=A0A9J6BVZ9_POLVA|nr:hypothetical protein PVAND_003736 [Polypedilum vanderplanki]